MPRSSPLVCTIGCRWRRLSAHWALRPLLDRPRAGRAGRCSDRRTCARTGRIAPCFARHAPDAPAPPRARGNVKPWRRRRQWWHGLSAPCRQAARKMGEERGTAGGPAGMFREHRSCCRNRSHALAKYAAVSRRGSSGIGPSDGRHDHGGEQASILISSTYLSPCVPARAAGTM